MKPQINMRQIEAFRAVMVSGSVVGAARLLNVTQPGVSRTIAHLELRLGYALFERRGRRLVPTPEAETLHRTVAQVYVGLERVAQVAQDLRFHRAGALRVATLPALAHGLAAEALARFSIARPQVALFVQSLASRDIAELVATDQFDAGLVELPLARAGIRVHPLEPVATVLVVPRGHRLAARKSVSVKELADEPMVLLSQHSYLRYRIDEAFTEAGVAPRAVIETPTSSLACALVAHGAGVTIVSRLAAAPFLQGRLVALPLKEELTSRYAVVFPELVAPSALALEFLQEVERLIAAG